MLKYITKTLHLKMQGKTDQEIEITLRNDLEKDFITDVELTNTIVKECLK